MLEETLLSLAALAAIVPAAVLAPLRSQPAPDRLFAALLALAAAGPLLYALRSLSGPWDSGLDLALWTSVAASLVLFAGLCLVTREGWRLAPLLLPYLLLLALLATLTTGLRGQVEVGGLPESWLVVHILSAVATYALATLGAVAALAVFLQERRLKRKTAGRLTALLPSVAEGERLQFRLLLAAEIVLGAGLATGLALRHFAPGPALVVDHKTLLSLAAFLLIALLLWLQRYSGLRGRRAGRLVLLAYLLLTLAYPGVKFVTDVLAA